MVTEKNDRLTERFFLQPLMPPSLLRNIIMKSGIKSDKMVAFQTTTDILIIDNATCHCRKDTLWHQRTPPYSPN